MIVCTLAEEMPDLSGDFYGVDKGALYLAKQGIKMKVAIGDFDSIQPNDLEKIKQYAQEIIQLNPEKDQSDSQVAIELASQRGYTHGLILGGLGRRFDHSYVNLQLLLQSDISLTLQDQNNKIVALPEGKHTLKRDNYRYLSVFSQGDGIISINGVKYPLENYAMKKNNLIGLSNEIIESEAHLELKNCSFLIIQSKD